MRDHDDYDAQHAQAHEHEDAGARVDPEDLPPIWRKHKITPPSRPIDHVHVYIDNQKAGRLDGERCDTLDEYGLRSAFPILEKGTHEVRLNFRSAYGRGSLGQIALTIENGFQVEEPEQDSQNDTAVHAAISAMQGISRVMMQNNERQSRMLLDTVQQNAETQISSHKELMQMFAMSMERDREANRAALERESIRAEREAEREASRNNSSVDSMREMMAMVVPMLAGGKTESGGDMATDAFKNFMMQTMIEKGMDQFQQAMDGGSQDGLGKIIQALGPALAAKFGGETPPEGAG